MKRKVIKQGNNTLTITLPRKWTQKFGINVGDEISLEEQDNKLLLSSEKVSSPQSSVEISFHGLNQPIFWRHMVSAYRAGYDTIKIHFDPQAEYQNIYTSYADFNKKMTVGSIEVVRDAFNGLIGMEIIDHKRDFCVVKDLGEITDKEFDNAFRRIFFLIEGMGEDNMQLLKERKESLFKAIDITDTTVDRFCDYCLRVLNKKSYKNFKKTSVMYSFVLLLEYIGDEYKRVSRHIFNLKNKENHQLRTLFEDTNKLFSLFSSLFYNFKKEKMIQLYEDTEKLKVKIKKSKFSDEEKEIVHHLKKISRFITDLLQLRIDLEM